MTDLPVPRAGGSYLRNDETGELTRVAGPSDDITAPLDVEQPTVDVPPEEPVAAPADPEIPA